MVEYVFDLYNIYCVIFFNLTTIALARICATEIQDYWLRFILEFLLVTLPTLGCILLHGYLSNIISILGAAICFVIFWKTANTEYIKAKHIILDSKPQFITLLRSSINYMTSICILAVDFDCFPKYFRKTRSFGIGLMDVGIGLYVFSMGLVSPRAKLNDFHKIISTVGYLLTLGTLRTVAIRITGYHQDECEYGVHLNAFVTLGCTKLFGGLISALAKNDTQLLIVAIGIILIYESILQCGLSDFVMSSDIPRDNIISANREGLCSLIGFISLYLIAVYIGSNIRTCNNLKLKDLFEKSKVFGKMSIIMWLLLFFCIFTIGIARVTCNFGYILCILSIALTMLVSFFIVFDVGLGTLRPISCKNIPSKTDAKHLNIKVPLIMESINYNSLSYFLFANVLTGLFNIFLKLEEKSTFESYVLLLAYMFTINLSTFLLYLFRIRLA